MFLLRLEGSMSVEEVIVKWRSIREYKDEFLSWEEFG